MRNDICETCIHFIGGGDYNLCCTEKYGLVYQDSPICNLYSPMTEEQYDEYRKNSSIDYVQILNMIEEIKNEKSR